MILFLLKLDVFAVSGASFRHTVTNFLKFRIRICYKPIVPIRAILTLRRAQSKLCRTEK